jgi:hypothetical protein
MRRRRLLTATGGVAGLVGLSGCLGYVYPEVTGTVRAKTFAGRTDGEWQSLVEVTGSGTEVAAVVRGEGSGPGVIGQYLTERLVEGPYDAVRFTLTLALSTRDPVNGVAVGDSHVYEVDREAFNAVGPGQTVDARVARFGAGRLSYVAGGGADVDGVEGG